MIYYILIGFGDILAVLCMCGMNFRCVGVSKEKKKLICLLSSYLEISKT
jgi:hypothetical protein